MSWVAKFLKTWPLTLTQSETVKDTAIAKTFEQGNFRGYAVENVPYGDGKIDFPGGASFDGNWVNGKMDGEGYFIFGDEHNYVGEYKAGVMVGDGNYSFPR